MKNEKTLRTSDTEMKNKKDKRISDTEIENIINKKSIHYIKNNCPLHFQALKLGAFAIKNNIKSLEELETLIDINTRILNK